VFLKPCTHCPRIILSRHVIDVDISYGSEHMMLRLARDSGDPKEYWVFFPKYRITSTNEVARIKTAAFDSY
jgi:hypothetical protein